MKRSHLGSGRTGDRSHSHPGRERVGPGDRDRLRARGGRGGRPHPRRAGPARVQGPRRAEVPHEDRQERRLHPPQRLLRPLPHHAEEGGGRGAVLRLQHAGARPPPEAARLQAPPAEGAGRADARLRPGPRCPSARRRAGGHEQAGERDQRRHGPLAGGQGRRGHRRLRGHPGEGTRRPPRALQPRERVQEEGRPARRRRRPCAARSS